MRASTRPFGTKLIVRNLANKNRTGSTCAAAAIHVCIVTPYHFPLASTAFESRLLIQLSAVPKPVDISPAMQTKVVSSAKTVASAPVGMVLKCMIAVGRNDAILRYQNEKWKQVRALEQFLLDSDLQVHVAS